MPEQDDDSRSQVPPGAAGDGADAVPAGFGPAAVAA